MRAAADLKYTGVSKTLRNSHSKICWSSLSSLYRLLILRGFYTFIPTKTVWKISKWHRMMEVILCSAYWEYYATTRTDITNKLPLGHPISEPDLRCTIEKISVSWVRLNRVSPVFPSPLSSTFLDRDKTLIQLTHQRWLSSYDKVFLCDVRGQVMWSTVLVDQTQIEGYLTRQVKDFLKITLYRISFQWQSLECDFGINRVSFMNKHSLDFIQF